MVCLYCRGILAVINSRPQKSRNQIWRRRRCQACGAVFTAIEAIDLSQAIAVIKNDSDGLQAFDRDKLFISLYKSLLHRTEPAADARGLTDTVVAVVAGQALNGQIATQAIAASAHAILRRFDTIAATHYAAFHPATNSHKAA